MEENYSLPDYMETDRIFIFFSPMNTSIQIPGKYNEI